MGKNNTKLPFSMDYDNKTFLRNKDIAKESITTSVIMQEK